MICFSEVNVGDTVTIRRKDAHTTTVTFLVTGAGRDYISGAGIWAYAEHWEVVSYDRPKPPLPTTPGVYQSEGYTFMLSGYGEWYQITYQNHWRRDERYMECIHRGDHPLVRLVPEVM